MKHTPCAPENSVGWTVQQPWPHPGPSRKYGTSGPSTPQNTPRLRKRLLKAASARALMNGPETAAE